MCRCNIDKVSSSRLKKNGLLMRVRAAVLPDGKCHHVADLAAIVLWERSGLERASWYLC
jgi:hypothetical protein